MKVWFLWLLLRTVVQSYIFSGRPVPKADLLEEVLAKFMNRSDYTGSVFNYLAGNEDFGDPDNLDVCILDVNNVFKIVGAAKKKYEGHFRRTKQEAIQNNPKLIEMTMDLIKQSLYATRFRLKDTKRFRKKYTTNIRFNLAIYYGALMQISLKIEMLYSIMQRLPKETHFLWYLILYEKMLAAHVDIHNMVERIFDLHYKQRARDAGVNAEIIPTIRTTTLNVSSSKRSRGTGRRFTTRPTVYIPDENSASEEEEEPDMHDEKSKRARYATIRTATTTLRPISTTTKSTTNLYGNIIYSAYVDQTQTSSKVTASLPGRRGGATGSQSGIATKITGETTRGENAPVPETEPKDKIATEPGNEPGYEPEASAERRRRRKAAKDAFYRRRFL